MNVRFSARGGKWIFGVVLTLAWAVSAFAIVFAAYSLGDLSLQNGWDSGITGNAFTNNNSGTDVVENTPGVAFTGTQYWRYGGSYGSPGSGTPFTPYVATVGAPNAMTAFGAGMNSPVTPAGDQSVISFAFKAVAPGDSSQINAYEGNRDLADPSRTGPNLYITATSATDVTLHRFHLSSTDQCSNQDFPDLTLATVAASAWHTVKITTTYPNVNPSDFSTYGTTIYVIDEGTGGQVTVTDSDAVWVHQFNQCNGSPYSPGTALKWSSSFNDPNPSPAHQGFYIDDVSMKVINTGTGTTVASFATSFEAAPLNQAALSVNATSPASFGSTQTLTTSGGSGGGAVSYSVGASTACSVAGDQLTITSSSGTCAVTATKAADAVYNPITSSPVTVTVQAADLSITKTAVGGPPFAAGASLSYTISIVNNGPGSASSVVVTDVLPAGTTFVSATPSQGSCSGTTTVTCAVGVLANSGSATITLVLTTASTPGTVSNTATVAAAESDPTPANNSSTSTITTVNAATIPAASEYALLALAGMLALLGAMRTRV